MLPCLILAHMAKLKPFKHQARFVRAHWDDPFYALHWEQGTGKTKALLDNATKLHKRGEIDGVLVVAPNGVHRNWVTDEIPLHATNMHGAFFTSGKAKTQKHKRMMNAALESDFPLIAMSFEGFMTKAGTDYAKKFFKNRKVMFIVDESTGIKTPGAKRTKRIVAAGKLVEYRRNATGTPVANSPLDIYSQFLFLDQNFWKARGFSNYYVFKNYFGIWVKGVNKQQGGREFQHCVGFRNLEELHEMIAPYASRVTKDEVLDLEPKLYSKRYFELTKEQRRVYGELKDQAITFVDKYDAERERVLTEGGTPDPLIVAAPLAIVRLLRLHQVTSGYLPADDEDEETMVPLGTSNPRLECLMTLLEEVPHSAIIWARFRHDIDLIMERLGERAVRYDGKVNDEDRAKNKAAFNAGDAQFFVGNPAAGGKGLTLITARTVIYYNNDFRLENRLQSEDRAHRIGQKYPVNVVDIIAPDTVDEHIVKALRNKVNVARVVTGDNLKEWI